MQGMDHRRRNQGGTGGMCSPKFHELLYKLLATLYVVSNCAPQSKSLSYVTVDNSRYTLRWDVSHSAEVNEGQGNLDAVCM